MNSQILYTIFQLIKNEMDWENNARSCQAILESVYSILNNDHWKVIGITKLAYDAIVKNNFDIRIDGRSIVCRAHINDRRETFLNIMKKRWNNGREIYDYMKSRDICYLSVKKENKKINKSMSYIDVPKKLNLFMPRAIGFSFDKKVERKWLVNLAIK